jgi:serine/threonine protein kinase
MLKAIHYCHNVIKVIHRDIKPDNIMINHNDEAVLIDFGVSALCDGNDDELNNTQGSYMFFAPELFERVSKNLKIKGE